MKLKTMEKIAWWIPIKKYRDKLKKYISYHFVKEEYIYDTNLLNYFKKCILEDTNFENKYKKLISNLDEESIDFISDLVFNKILKEEKYFNSEEAKIRKKCSYEMSKNIKKINDECYGYHNLMLPINHFEGCVFYDKHSIDKLETLDNIKNKNIIDAGGFVGDSAIIFSEYTDKNVYSFEPMKNNFNLMLKTIEMNKKKNIIPINMALGEKEEVIKVYNNKVSSALSLLNKCENDKENESIVNVTTLDKYVKENKIEVGLIKTDLEGYEQKFLQGAINTIKEQKPTLLISIYHNYSDFFEIKPMIENLNLGYKFKIVPSSQCTAILETLLIAEVI